MKTRNYLRCFAQSFAFFVACGAIHNSNAEGSADLPQLIASYNANEVRFKRDFKDHVFVGKGAVLNIGPDFIPFQLVYNNLVRSYSIRLLVGKYEVRCSTTDEETTALLDKGMEINFSGKIFAVVFGTSLWLDECSFPGVHAPKPIQSH